MFWFCWMWLVAVVGCCLVGCGHYEGFCWEQLYPKHVQTEVNKHQIVASCWFFYLHNFLTMQGHRNLKLSSVFRWTPYLWQCSICMILFMWPKVCASSLTCFAKLHVWLLLLKAFSCSLNRVAKRLPACPTYALLQSGQVSLYTAGSENFSGGGFWWQSSFLIVFVVWNAILSSVASL